MSAVDKLKEKIEGIASTNLDPNYSDQEIKLVLDGPALSGQFNPEGVFGQGGGFGDYLNLLTLGFADALESETYADLFDLQFRQQLKNKSYSNLSYTELQYAIKIFDENTETFKKVVQNLSNDVLGPAFADFVFAEFDVKVSVGVNDLLKSGGSVALTRLPTVTFNVGQGAVIAKDPESGDSNSTESDVIDATKWDEIVSAYNAQNGQNITVSNATVRYDPDLKLEGNVSSISKEFYLSEIEEGGVGFLNTIIDFVMGASYKSPQSIVNATYKAFLIAASDDTTNIEGFFKTYSEEAITTIAKYLAYDFEYERRMNLPEAIEANPDATADDILNAAEAAALNDLAGSGLVGAGGISNKTPVDPEKIERFFEQCILLASMDKLKDTFLDSIKQEGQIDNSDPSANKGKIHLPTPYQERFYMVQVPTGLNDRLVNFLNAPRGEIINDFLNLTPDIQSFLTPKIRLYKVFNDGNKLKQVEFIFRNSTDDNDVLKTLFRDNDKFFRGSGYGIKDLSLSFNGTTPATAKNDITADLTLFFQDFSDFVTPVKTTEGEFKFVDLIFYDKKNSSNPLYGYGATHPDQYSPAYYRIRADVGWRVPENHPQFDDACRKRNIDPDNVRSVIERTNRSYYLNMVEHELDFKKDGTVEIKAQYRGYVESVLKGTEMDALVDQAILDDRKARQQELEKALRTCTPGEIAQIKRIYNAEEQKIIEKLYQRTYKRLLELGKVRSFKVIDDKGFRENGYFEGRPSIQDMGADTGLGYEEHQYYFLGDLLYIMLDAIYADNSTAPPIGKTKIVLPTIEFEDFFDGSGVFAINIAQVPISHRYFTEWWADNVIKQKKESYPIMFYLRDIMNNLIADALVDTCLNRDYRKSFNFQTTSVMASDDPLANVSSINSPIITLDEETLPFKVEEGSDINNMTNYVIVYPAYSTILPKGTGQYVEDLEKGVYHFHLGQDRGIIHDIKFSKVDMAYIREARYLREGVDGLLQLGAVYRVTLNMFGNTLFYPGMLLYVNPFGLGGEDFLPNKPNSIANKLGLGGYHIIEKVNSSITSGLFKTTVEAMFVYSGDGDTRFNIQGKQEDNPDENIEAPSKVDPTCPNLVSDIRDRYIDSLEPDPLVDSEDITKSNGSSTEPPPSGISTEPALISETDPDGSTDTQSINQTPLGTIGTPDGQIVKYYRVTNEDGKITYYDQNDNMIVQYG